MSHEAISFVKTLYVPQASHKLFLMAIAERISNETFECYPSQALLARECSKSERHIRRIGADLETAGMISRRERKKRNGHADSDAYKITGFSEWFAIVESLKVGDAEAATRKLIQMQQSENQRKNPTGHRSPVGGAAKPNPTGHGSPVANRTLESAKPSEENPKNQLTSFVDSPSEQTNVASPKKGRAKQGVLPGTEDAVMTPGERRAAEAAQRDAEAMKALRKEEDTAFAAYNAVARRMGGKISPRLTSRCRHRIRQLLNMEGEWPTSDGAFRVGRLSFAGWMFALKKAEASSFYRGETHHKFQMMLEYINEDAIVKLVSGFHDDRDRQSEEPEPRVSCWKTCMELWQARGRSTWPAKWGPAPGEVGCEVPQDLLEKYHITAAA